MNYVFNFEGTCEIIAGSEEEAIDKFWNYINDNIALPSNTYDITNIEEEN